jgi:hypothetical protein
MLQVYKYVEFLEITNKLCPKKLANDLQKYIDI